MDSTIVATTRDRGTYGPDPLTITAGRAPAGSDPCLASTSRVGWCPIVRGRYWTGFGGGRPVAQVGRCIGQRLPGETLPCPKPLRDKAHRSHYSKLVPCRRIYW